MLLAHALISGAARANAEEISIGVASDQRVSVSGRGSSQRSVIEEVCYRAGVDLLFYDAADRPFGGDYAALALPMFLERVLRDESYIVETVSHQGMDVPYVTTLRVLGDPAVAALRRASSPRVRRRPRFQVPPSLVSTAMSADAAGREAALSVLGARIAGDPTQLQGFLATEPRLIAEAIRRHEGAEEALRELQQRYPDPRISGKIEEVLAALKAMTSVASARN